MATKKRYIDDTSGPPPRTLDGHPFYGLLLDPDQKAFAEAILNPEKLIVFVNAPAGTGKTLVSMGAANLLVQHGAYEGIVCIVFPCNEKRQGYLPGDVSAKSEVYCSPAYQAMVSVGLNPHLDASTDGMFGQKGGDTAVTLLTDTFLRGVNFHNKVIICDESENASVPILKKVLTRIADDCKVIVIGHTGQIDLDDPSESGFEKYIEHFRGDPRAEICQLHTNHRGWISSHADELN